MSTKSTEAARAAAINSAYDVAERPIDADDLALIQTSLDSSRSIATGETSADDIGVEFAAEAVEFFGDVVADPAHPFHDLWVTVTRRAVRLGLLPAHPRAGGRAANDARAVGRGRRHPNAATDVAAHRRTGRPR